MKLVIYNGSPRKKKSNSRLLIEAFLRGYSQHQNDNVEIHYLASLKKREQHLQACTAADVVLIIFPLYTDCMPGIVKEFLEKMAPLTKNTSKKFTFIVQSGFPESIHSEYIARYLEKYKKRLNGHYLGTAIKGGLEGIRIILPWMQNKTFRLFEDLGKSFGDKGIFEPSTLKKMAKPYKMPKARLMMFALFEKLGFANFYWDTMLKQNNAYEKRFDAPFLEQ